LQVLARRAGLGRARLRVLELRRLTLRGAVDLAVARRRYLRQICSASPIAAGPRPGAVELHMLLHHARIYEGLWGLYSFAHFSRQPTHIFVHNDGSLTNADTSLISRILPGCAIIARHLADTQVLDFLDSEQLPRCAAMRRSSFVLSLKLFDPFVFAQQDEFILMDSDVLFFDTPDALLESKDNLYSVDVGYDYGYGYNLSRDELAELLGRPCIERLNSGVVKARRDAVDFHRVERHLEYMANTDSWSHYAEQTLWAIEMTLSNALPLPPSYAICPRLRDNSAISGHYCGGGYFASLYYTRALPRLKAEFNV
jgi:hypothetical protein